MLSRRGDKTIRFGVFEVGVLLFRLYCLLRRGFIILFFRDGVAVLLSFFQCLPSLVYSDPIRFAILLYPHSDVYFHSAPSICEYIYIFK